MVSLRGWYKKIFSDASGSGELDLWRASAPGMSNDCNPLVCCARGRPIIVEWERRKAFGGPLSFECTLNLSPRIGPVWTVQDPRPLGQKQSLTLKFKSSTKDYRRSRLGNGVTKTCQRS
ncbi:hypothetical protein EVAR_31293_1 [Eumeta japonica]|uniref:Uncharacterized protein n=1 Tax=Eumeta variegata TaxID=151549 RepID=A0A4C1VPW7_EUMVA|nr:hypothetical protein EVAR_31293_1 [Eumeta japonica]